MADEPLTVDRLRILLVEDQPYMRQIIRQTLERLRVTNIYEAEEGGEALKMTVRLRPNIVLCDVHMEPMNGLEYLEKLREFKNEAIANTPVIFLTADSGESTVLTGRKHKVNGYIVKPTSAAKLIENINRILGPVLPTR